MAAEPTISLHDAQASIDDRVLWSGVNLDIMPGEFAVILGPNGAGKSTLLKGVLGLQHLSAGSVTVLGKPAGDENREIGYLPQRRSFDERLPIRGVDVVRLGLDGDRWGWPIPFIDTVFQRKKEIARRALVDETISSVGASGYANRPIGQTSGGEQQRLLIAQALVRNPRVLLLDEPLDSLDLPNQHSVSSLIKTIADERQITVLMVAHDVNPILPYVDRVIYVANGQVLSGTPEEVIRTETLSALYDSPVEVLRAGDGRLVVVGAPDSVHAHSHVAR